MILEFVFLIGQSVLVNITSLLLKYFSSQLKNFKRFKIPKLKKSNCNGVVYCDELQLKRFSVYRQVLTLSFIIF